MESELRFSAMNAIRFAFRFPDSGSMSSRMSRLLGFSAVSFYTDWQLLEGEPGV
jgi:hypothetical protein